MSTIEQTGLKQAADEVLRSAVERDGGVPGVVAMATDRQANTYEGAFGKNDLGSGSPMTTESVFALFSTTKAITGTAVMALVEDGKIKLDEAAKTYVPEIAEIKVLEGFDPSGEPRLRAAKSDITVRHLLTHTAGFGYDFFNYDILKYLEKTGIPSVVSSTKASLDTVLLFDPGERWEYGSNIDWAGRVAEAASGKRLGELFQERIFGPLDMHDIGFTLSPEMGSRRATIHTRGADGSLTPAPEILLPQEPEQHMGGHGLYGTVGAYMKFIRMILNDGAGAHGRVLKPETVQTMAQNHIGPLKITMLPGAAPQYSNDAEFFPGMPKSWGLTFMINDEEAPTGRPAGALAWAGLANLYYWIDRENGVGGFWATQIFPFIDGVSVPGYFDFETAVYDNLR
jgi:methyl acetate hydrolase